MDWRNPPYADIFIERRRNLEALRAAPLSHLEALKNHYRNNPGQFINDWGMTFDPRNAERNLPTVIPFVLFEKQIEFVNWVVGRWRNQQPGLCEKSRDMGISWLSTALACTLCIFYDGLAIGFGSRKEDYVDKVGTMKPLLPKAKMFMEALPHEFAAGYRPGQDGPFMRLNFPETNSIITGEAGDQIGRGDRASIYFVDEAAYLERPELVEHSLSQTTNCRIDMSSVNGMNNPFARKRHAGKINVFIFDWRDDPRKDEYWYKSLEMGEDEEMVRPDGSVVKGKGLDPVTIAQEVDRDYQASVSGIVIPAKWVQACIGAREKLEIPTSGLRGMALDIADEGTDKNAAACVEGIEVVHLAEWSGKNSDIFETVERAFTLCDERGYRGFRYDADGLGAGARGDARIINERRKESKQKPLVVVPYRGSGAVFEPDALVEGTMGGDGDKGRTNKDYFHNRKAQAWWTLRRRIQKTYRWVTEGRRANPDEIFSIDPKCPLAMQLVAELSQATYKQNGVGKMLINKQPDGMKSPNLADAVVARYAPLEAQALNITPEVMQSVMGRRTSRRAR